MAARITLDQRGPCPSEMPDVITASFYSHKPTPGETEPEFQMTSKTRITTYSLCTQRAWAFHRNAGDKNSNQRPMMENCGLGWCMIDKTTKLLRKGSRWTQGWWAATLLFFPVLCCSSAMEWGRRTLLGSLKGFNESVYIKHLKQCPALGEL